MRMPMEKIVSGMKPWTINLYNGKQQMHHFPTSESSLLRMPKSFKFWLVMSPSLLTMGIESPYMHMSYKTWYESFFTYPLRKLLMMLMLTKLQMCRWVHWRKRMPLHNIVVVYVDGVDMFQGGAMEPTPSLLLMGHIVWYIGATWHSSRFSLSVNKVVEFGNANMLILLTNPKKIWSLQGLMMKYVKTQ